MEKSSYFNLPKVKVIYFYLNRKKRNFTALIRNWKSLSGCVLFPIKIECGFEYRVMHA